MVSFISRSMGYAYVINSRQSWNYLVKGYFYIHVAEDEIKGLSFLSFSRQTPTLSLLHTNKVTSD